MAVEDEFTPANILGVVPRYSDHFTRRDRMLADVIGIGRVHEHDALDLNDVADRSRTQVNGTVACMAQRRDDCIADQVRQ